jgi:LysR family transcriptional regulator for bpeEF and oprC
MDKFQAMLVFTRVVDAKSFSHAADSLNLPRSSVTTIVQGLEAHLKVRLLNRTTRRLSLTPEGAAYYERCSRILSDVEDSENALLASDRAPRGKLKVDVPGVLGRLLVVPALHEFHARYPDVELMLGVGDRAVDLVHEGVDCAIRMGWLQDSSLIARRIGSSRFITAASPDYLRHHGEPRSIEALNSHTVIHYFSSRGNRIMPMSFSVDGQTAEVKTDARLAINDRDTYLQCGLQGLGLIQVPDFVAIPHLQTGKLIEVLAPWRPAPFPVSAIYPHNRHLSPQVRVFVEWIAEQFEKSAQLSAEGTKPTAGPRPPLSYAPSSASDIGFAESAQ